MISFGPVSTFPTLISFGPFPVCSLISFGPLPVCPTLISFGPVSTFPTIINFGPAPNFSVINFGPAPTISVDWGTAPSLTCTVSIVCPTSKASAFVNTFDDDPSLNVELGDIGIPSVIKILAPVIPDIKILHDIPALIKIESLRIPSIIKLTSDFNIPSEIRIVSEGIPDEIKLVSQNIPSVIFLEPRNLPNFIRIEVPDDFPRTIKIDASNIPNKIQVVGIPPSIEIVGSIPSEIRLVMPEKPEIELVYKGAPIDIKIQLDVSKLNGENEKMNCVAIVPCNPS